MAASAHSNVYTVYYYMFIKKISWPYIESDDKRLNIEGYNFIRVTTQETKKGEGYKCTIKTIYEL